MKEESQDTSTVTRRPEGVTGIVAWLKGPIFQQCSPMTGLAPARLGSNGIIKPKNAYIFAQTSFSGTKIRSSAKSTATSSFTPIKLHS
jgi:hypothetical protein